MNTPATITDRLPAEVSPLDEAALRAMLEALDDEARAAVRTEIHRLHALSR